MNPCTRSLGPAFVFALGLAWTLGVAGACTGKSGPQGHATYFQCHEGRVVSFHVPLGEDPQIEAFKGCDDGRCVAPGETCPEPEPKPGPKPDGACTADSECAWDDDCVPTACVRASGPAVPTNCDETAPPPGECKCVEQSCTLVNSPVPVAPVAPVG